MTQFLSVANKLISWRGVITLSDELDQTIFEAKGEHFFSPNWSLFRGSKEVAVIRKRIFAWASTWEVKSDLGDFVIKRKIFPFTRQYLVKGGAVDGAIISGNFISLKFEIILHNHLIAKARAKILTLRDRHNVEVLDSSEDSLLFTAIAMVVLQLDRKSEADD